MILLDDDLVAVARNPKFIHKELTLTTLIYKQRGSIAAVDEETGPVTGPVKKISEATPDDRFIWEGIGEEDNCASPKNTGKVICNMSLMGEQSTISYRP